MLESDLVFCTLLGPEGPGRYASTDRTSGPCCEPAMPGSTGYRPYFENYTVDASILDSTERSDHINDDS